MTSTRPMQQALSPDETLACDRVFDELFAELTGDTVVALDGRRVRPAAVAPGAHGTEAQSANA